MAGSKSGKGKRDKKIQGGKRKHSLTPASEDFSDSEFLKEKFSSKGEESPPPVPPCHHPKVQMTRWGSLR
jgi:hypothetical protein